LEVNGEGEIRDHLLNFERNDKAVYQICGIRLQKRKKLPKEKKKKFNISLVLKAL
jgi:hypothetical protein